MLHLRKRVEYLPFMTLTHLARRLSQPRPEMATPRSSRESKGRWKRRSGYLPPITVVDHPQTQPTGRKDTMKKFFAVVMSAAMFAAFSPLAEAQTSCPAEVAQAKEILSKKATTARSQDVQAPRSLAGARQDVQ